MNENRVLHSLGVANKMVELGKDRGLCEKELMELFVLGYNHDIGYQFDSHHHNEVGGEVLKNYHYPYWKEVYYHGIPNAPYHSEYLDILNMADMMINLSGEDVGFYARLEDIKSRHGEDSIPYKNCVQLVNELINKK